MKQISEDFLLFYFNEHHPEETQKHLELLHQKESYQVEWTTFCQKMQEPFIQNARFDLNRLESVLETFQAASHP